MCCHTPYNDNISISAKINIPTKPFDVRNCSRFNKRLGKSTLNIINEYLHIINCFVIQKISQNNSEDLRKQKRHEILSSLLSVKYKIHNITPVFLKGVSRAYKTNRYICFEATFSNSTIYRNLFPLLASYNTTKDILYYKLDITIFILTLKWTLV